MSSWVPCGGFVFPKFGKKSSSTPSTSTSQPSHPIPSVASSNEGVRGPPSMAVDLLRRHEEGVENYKAGGYHPVEIGEIYNNRYRVVKKLGWGHFSTVWLCEDLLARKNLPGEAVTVAMKVQKSGNAYAEAAVDEIHLLSTAAGIDSTSKYVVKLMDSFQVSGPNGLHYCMMFELLGDNLLALIRHFSKASGIPDRYGKGVPVHLVKKITREILMGLDYLHRKCQIIHTDLKPENILLQHALSDIIFSPHGEISEIKTCRQNNESRETLVKVVDLGNACWTHKHFTEYITTRQYRSPEAIVELHYSSAVDIWSLACIVFELITGDYLFEPRAEKNGAYTRDEDHLALMMELLGDAPESIKRKGRCSSNFFNRKGTLRNINDLVHWPLENLLQEKVNIPGDLAREIASFLTPMLEMDPSRRATAAQCLKHSFLVDSYQVVSANAELESVIVFNQNNNVSGRVWTGSMDNFSPRIPIDPPPAYHVAPAHVVSGQQGFQYDYNYIQLPQQSNGFIVHRPQPVFPTTPPKYHSYPQYPSHQ